MIPEELFDTQLFLLKSTGLVLSYRKDWRGVLMKLFALFGFLTVLMGAIFHTHVIFVTGKSIEEIGDAVSHLTVTIDGMVKILAFYFMRETYKAMVDSTLDILRKRQFS
jgi:hypothetical protein